MNKNAIDDYKRVEKFLTKLGVTRVIDYLGNFARKHLWSGYESINGGVNKSILEWEKLSDPAKINFVSQELRLYSATIDEKGVYNKLAELKRIKF